MGTPIEIIGAGERLARCRVFLEEMIAIPSVSGAENNLAAYIQNQFERVGFTVQRVELADGRFTILCDIGRQGGNDAEALMFVGHMDTVEAGEGWEQSDPFVPHIEGGRLYGRGACDMKAGLAVMVSLALELIEADWQGQNVRFLFVPDEEAHSAGIMAAINAGCGLGGEAPMSIAKATFCLMPEPHFNPIVYAAPGKMLIRVSVTGRAAHGARPTEGINAVTEAGKFLAALEVLESSSSPVMGVQRYVPLRINGGYRKYSLIVPECCEIIISRQLVPGETCESVLSDLRGLIGGGQYSAKFAFDVLPPYYPPYETDQTDPRTLRLMEIAERVTGQSMSLACGTSVSDANCITGLCGIPVLIFGPEGRNLHQANEWVSLESMSQVLEVYRMFIGLERGSER